MVSKPKNMKRQQRRAMQRQSAKQAARRSASSRQTRPALSLSGALPAGDNFAFVRDRLRDLAADREEWSGIPIPIDGERLIIEPSYKYASLSDIGKEATQPEDYTVRNIFYSHSKRSDVAVFREYDGRITHALLASIHHLGYDIRTLGCSDAWGLEQESAAMELLASLVSHRQIKQYTLTGMFLETSKRSGVTYLFRRLKPTVAMRPAGETMRIMCALCQHPIGYYEGSWAGAMCPTDDVVAHLSMMRADEPMYWRRSNQHAAHRPEAGL